jgi:hypothetical protein
MKGSVLPAAIQETLKSSALVGLAFCSMVDFTAYRESLASTDYDIAPEGRKVIHESPELDPFPPLRRCSGLLTSR